MQGLVALDFSRVGVLGLAHDPADVVRSSGGPRSRGPWRTLVMNPNKVVR
jgi:hypothetical protein